MTSQQERPSESSWLTLKVYGRRKQVGELSICSLDWGSICSNMAELRRKLLAIKIVKRKILCNWFVAMAQRDSGNRTIGNYLRDASGHKNRQFLRTRLFLIPTYDFGVRTTSLERLRTASNKWQLTINELTSAISFIFWRTSFFWIFTWQIAYHRKKYGKINFLKE